MGGKVLLLSVAAVAVTALEGPALLTLKEADSQFGAHAHKGMEAATASAVSGASASVVAQVDAWLESGSSVMSAEVERAAIMSVDPWEVVDKLEERMTPDVQAWVEKARTKKTISTAEAQGPFSEAALNKARRKLNGMVETAQKELDIRMIECKEFKEKNRETLRQVRADLARLGENIAGSKAHLAKSHAGIEEAGGSIDKQQGMAGGHKQQCLKTKSANQKQLDILKDDLAVAEFIVKMTECKGLFTQTDAHSLQSCVLRDGDEVVYFNDEGVSSAATKLQSQRVNSLLQKALQSSLVQKEVQYTSAKRSIGLMVQSSHLDGQSIAMGMVGDVAKPVTKKITNNKKQQNKCVLGKPNCGLLNDNMSLMWGEVKDSVDELEAIMAKNAAECKKINDNFNIEIGTWQTTLNNFNVELAEATGELNAQEEEQREKLTDERELKKEYSRVWGQCKDDIHEILFTNICGVKSVRGEIAKYSTGTMKPTDIRDCEVTDWQAAKCSKSCKGGIQTLKRTAVQQRNMGAKCPVLTLKKKCNEFPCPVNCKMHSWSKWGKCSKECGGGLEQRVRNLKRKPDNGGEACGATQDERQCNVQSCDVDCRLRKWTKWLPCSRGCGGGIREKLRRVKSKARGDGKCPTKKSGYRYKSGKCNRFKCPAKPKCIATQDVVFVVDSSGSFKNGDNFGVVKKFMTELTGLYSLKAGDNGGPGKKPIRGHATMGIVQFSKEAKIVLPMTADRKKLNAGITGLKYMKGLTDMAKGLTMASTVMMEGRKAAQSIVMVITDGKPSFQYATRIAANKIKREGARLVFVNIQTFADLKFIKTLSSFPTRDNVIHINGLKKLFKDTDKEAARVLTSTCGVLKLPKKNKSKTPAPAPKTSGKKL